MDEHGMTRNFTVYAEEESGAKHKARIEMCHKLGISTGFFRYVDIQRITNRGRA